MKLFGYIEVRANPLFPPDRALLISQEDLAAADLTHAVLIKGILFDEMA